MGYWIRTNSKFVVASLGTSLILAVFVPTGWLYAAVMIAALLGAWRCYCRIGI